MRVKEPDHAGGLLKSSLLFSPTLVVEATPKRSLVRLAQRGCRLFGLKPTYGLAAGWHGAIVDVCQCGLALSGVSQCKWLKRGEDVGLLPAVKERKQSRMRECWELKMWDCWKCFEFGDYWAIGESKDEMSVVVWASVVLVASRGIGQGSFLLLFKEGVQGKVGQEVDDGAIFRTNYELNTLIHEGKEMASVLYTYRSCVKALPQVPTFLMIMSQLVAMFASRVLVGPLIYRRDNPSLKGCKGCEITVDELYLTKLKNVENANHLNSRVLIVTLLLPLWLFSHGCLELEKGVE
ncbi:hypothetical protein HPP92_012608 [Vanilla planifolia]|uniref:Uncharacterized protein n=1 Tax=Vanilla planifolia TaxID=51239 RepID=A0A835QSG2_VANPL|nr:hypothetical protein HPP92_012608 [Vanilla planifolia]